MSLELCSDDHDEICYEHVRHGECPLCAANQEIENLQEQINLMDSDNPNP